MCLGSGVCVKGWGICCLRWKLLLTLWFEVGTSNEKSCLQWSVDVASPDCSRLNAGTWADYLSSQLSWVTVWWFNSHTCLPCSSSRWVTPCVLYPLMINGDSVDVLLGWWADEYGFSTLGVDSVLGNECGIQEQNYVELLQRSEMTAGYHYKNWELCAKCFRSFSINMLQ